jgi:3-isopropylmalate/(R)-2-methylmalate dehydratase large subunit
MPTLSEKILAASSGRETVEPGDVVDARVDLAMTHESCARVIDAFDSMGAKTLWNPDKVVVVLDHWAPAPTMEAALIHKRIREFVKDKGIKKFHDIGAGICHQIIAEEGYVEPGQVVVGTDSHTTTSGALGAFSVGIGPTEMAAVFALGKLWLKVPHTIRVVLEGRIGKTVSGKDAALGMLGRLGTDGASYKALEFSGTGLAGIGIADRMTLTNMCTEMGAKSALIPPDEKTMEFLGEGNDVLSESCMSDDDANFQQEHTFDLGSIEPLVACPDGPADVRPASEVKSVNIDQAFLGSCTNGRLEDIRAAVDILKGKRISKDVRFIVSPASRRIFADAVREGLIESLLESGAVVCGPTCGPCFGGHTGILGSGEVCISTSNRNFVGRMGAPDSKVYLASPYTVAASALTGEITDPRCI